MGTVVLAILLLVYPSMRLVVSNNVTPTLKINVCNSTECRDLSELIRGNMNTEVNPCKDFYKYVCGKWTERFVPYGAYTWTQLLERRTVMYGKVAEYLGQKVKHKDIYPVQWAKRHFQACMNQDKLNSLGVRPLLQLVNDIGGWSILGGNPKNTWTVVHQFYAQMTGQGALFNIEVGPRENFKHNVLIISPPERFFLHHISRSNEADIKEYEKFLADVSSAFRKEQHRRKLPLSVTSAINDVLRFREAITERQNQTRKSPRTTMTTILDLQMHTRRIMQTKELDWLHVLQSTFKDLGDFTINESTIVFVQHFHYLNVILKAIESTQLEVLLDHIHFYFLERFIQETSNRMNDLFYQVLKQPVPERSVTCVSSNAMKTIVNYIYVKNFLTDETISAARDIAFDVRGTLKHQISRSKWIDKSTTRMAIEKLDEMEYVIGYNEWYANGQNMIDYYTKTVPMELSDDYLHNILRFETMSYKAALRRLWTSKTEKLDKPTPDPFSATAAYNYVTNQMLLPAALLQVPSFGTSLPNAVNYGGIGTIMGYTFSRTFDSIGRHYDGKGNRMNWWTNGTLKEFKRRLKRYAKKIEEADTNNSLDKIVTEYMGLVASYETYRQEFHSTVESEAIIHLEKIAGDKLFFVVYATGHCEAFDVRKFMSTMEREAHLPRRLRLNAAVSNMQAFANAFDCKKKDPMNRSDKCEWLDESVLPSNQGKRSALTW